jgi:uncharacterized protein with ATP-grasp and redox domains
MNFRLKPAQGRIEDSQKGIDNGSNAPGTILDNCSRAFHDRFKRADVIIAKGQGNFETLREASANIFSC